MAFILGQQGIGWTQEFEAQGFSSGAAYFGDGYPAQFSGTLNTVNITLGTPISATSLQVCLYNASDVLVATSAAITISGAGNFSAAISGSLVNGLTYFPVISMNGGYANLCYNNGTNNFVTNQNNSTNFPYASPPSTLPAPDETIGHEYLIWLDGSPAGASVAWFRA